MQYVDSLFHMREATNGMYQFLADKSVIQTVFLGALGSAVFWLFLKIIQFLFPRLIRSGAAAWAEGARGAKFREYIYLRYTSMEGLAPSFTGFQYSVRKALSAFFSGLMFCCIALLIGGSSKFVWAICMVAGLVYFSNAWSWVTTPVATKPGTPGEHWRRIAQLEKELFGSVENETEAFLKKFNQTPAGEQPSLEESR